MYRISIEPNEVGSLAIMLLGVYDSEELCRLDCQALFYKLGDSIKTIAVKKFAEDTFEVLDVYDGQHWESEIIAHQEEEYARHGA